MHASEVVALGYRYPTPFQLDELKRAVSEFTRGVVRTHMEAFLAEIEILELGEWEELHTATLDLSPKFVPYIGHVAWGENYRRGEFMADLKRDMERCGVDPLGELPDHIEPVLRYLASTRAPLDDLLGVLADSVSTMREVLVKADAKNPYRHLLSATSGVIEEFNTLSIGPIR